MRQKLGVVKKLGWIITFGKKVTIAKHEQTGEVLFACPSEDIFERIENYVAKNKQLFA